MSLKDRISMFARRSSYTNIFDIIMMIIDGESPLIYHLASYALSVPYLFPDVYIDVDVGICLYRG